MNLKMLQKLETRKYKNLRMLKLLGEMKQRKFKKQ